MFWNKDKIPSYKIDNNDDFLDEDLFKLDEEDEQNILEYDTDTDNYEDEEKIEEDEEETSINTHFDTMKLLNKIINIALITVVILGIFISIDVISVTRGGVGPFFAIKTKTYNNGTKEYYGIGYKVIKYNIKSGLVDTKIGSWSLKYNDKAISTSVLDLGLDFNNNYDNFISVYNNNYLKVNGTVSKISDKYITLKYTDEDNKYTTSVTCNLMARYSSVKVGDSVKIVGTLYNYNKNKILNLEMKNCYIK